MKKINRSVLFVGLFMLTVVFGSAFGVDYKPWDELTADFWIDHFDDNDPEIYPINSDDANIDDSYTVSFSLAKDIDASEGIIYKASGMNGVKFDRYGTQKGHMVSKDLEGVFSVVNTGNDTYYRTVLLTIAIDAESLPSDFHMQIGIEGGEPNDLYYDDFVYYDNQYGRPSGYYSETNPSGEPLTYAFNKGMVTVFGIFCDPMLNKGDGLKVKYSFDSLPGAAVFSAYVQVKIKNPGDGEIAIPEIHHTNRAFLDQNNLGDSKNALSTFAVTISGDLDKDLDVDLSDLAIMASNWMKGTD